MEKDKFADILAWIGIIAIAIAAIWIGSMNHYKAHYQNAKPLSYQEACDFAKTAAGYPPGKDIPVARSIEDLMENEYCTIEVSMTDIQSTRVFLIKDTSEAGDFSSSAGKRGVRSEWHVEESYSLESDFVSDIIYNTRQVSWNWEKTSYGEWCAVTLESGEKIYILVDLTLLDIPTNGKIKLPIGQIKKSGQRKTLVEECENYGVIEENAHWYIDMVGNWEDTEVGDISPIKRSLVFFFIALVVCVCLELFVKHYRK